MFAAVVSPPADAQTQQIDALREKRDEARQEKARAAADLDPLTARNAEIEAGLVVLQEDLAARQAALQTTQTRLEAARIAVIEAQDEVEWSQTEIQILREELHDHAISAYVRPQGANIDDGVLSARTINEGERKRALMLAVSVSRNDILDDLRLAEAQLASAVQRAEKAQAEIAERSQLEAQQIAEVQDAVAKQERLHAILLDRIALFEAEIDSHEQYEQELTNELTGLIAQEEARKAAIREAARIAAERERVAREDAARKAQLEAQRAAGIATQQTVTVNRASAALDSAPQPAGGPSPGTLAYPVNGVLTSEFGPRWGRMHNGIDIAANTGTTVIASASGSVIAAGSTAGFGNRVIIDHGGGLVTLYAHMNSINVTKGQSVGSGQPIGTVGCTGSCTGPHVHFETRVNGVAYDPLGYLR